MQAHFINAFATAMPLRAAVHAPPAATCGTRGQCAAPRRRRLGARMVRDRFDKQGRQYIRLEQFLKLQRMASTGGEAKAMIAEGAVLVNGSVELRRGRKLRQGDAVSLQGDDVPLAVDFVPDDE